MNINILLIIAIGIFVAFTLGYYKGGEKVLKIIQPGRDKRHTGNWYGSNHSGSGGSGHYSKPSKGNSHLVQAVLFLVAVYLFKDFIDNRFPGELDRVMKVFERVDARAVKAPYSEKENPKHEWVVGVDSIDYLLDHDSALNEPDTIGTSDKDPVSPDERYLVQTLAATLRSGAIKRIRELEASGVVACYFIREGEAGNIQYNVCTGPFKSLNEAKAARESLPYEDSFVIPYEGQKLFNKMEE